MKTCYLVSYNGLSNAGGVERVCLYVSRIMSNKGYELKVVDRQTIDDYWMGKIVRTVCGKVPMLLSSVLSSFYVLQKRSEGDIVITNGFNCPFVDADMLFIHGTMAGHGEAIGTRYNWKRKLPLRFEKEAAKRAKHIVSVSHKAIEEVHRYYTDKTNGVTVINNMVDESIFRPLSEKDDANGLNIVFCGRLDYGKGVDKLYDLCAFIEEKGTDAKVIVATNNSHNADRFRNLKCVDLRIGLNIDQLNRFYNTGDVMYFPSMYEGFEMVTLEALSAGVPVLGNPVGAVKELSERGEPGIGIISDGTPSEIFGQLKALAAMYESPDKKDMLHRHYGSRYGVDAYIEKLDKVLSEISL